MVKIKQSWLQKFSRTIFILLPLITLSTHNSYALQSLVSMIKAYRNPTTTVVPASTAMAAYGRRTVTPAIPISEDMVSFDAIIKFGSQIPETVFSTIFKDEVGSIAVRPETTVTDEIEKENVAATPTYWIIYPANDAERNLKTRHAIKNGTTVKIINAYTGNPLAASGATINAGGGASNKDALWTIKLEETLDPYWKTGHAFSLKHNATGMFLSSAGEKEAGSDYSVVLQGKKTSNSVWKITEFNPTVMPQDLKSGNVIAIKCLGNDKYLKGFGQIIVEEDRKGLKNDFHYLRNKFFAAGETSNDSAAQFRVITSGDYIKLDSPFGTIKSVPTDVGFRRYIYQWGAFYNSYPSRGMLIGNIHETIGKKQVINRQDESWEEFRIEDGFFIKNRKSDGYLKLIGNISDYLEHRARFRKFKIKGTAVDLKESPQNYRVVSTYDKVLEVPGGIPNSAKDYNCYFAIKIISGPKLMPIIPEKEMERIEIYGEVEEEGLHKLDKPQEGRYTWIGKAEKAGAVEVIMSVNAVSSFFVGFSEKQRISPGAPIYEIVGGFGPTMIRNRHLKDVTDPKEGNVVQAPLLVREGWNDIWIKVVGRKISVGTGRIPGQNIVNEWEDPSRNTLQVVHIGISNWKDSAHFRIEEIRTPELKPEVAVEFFSDQLEEAKEIKPFDKKINEFIRLIPGASASDKTRKEFIGAIEELVKVSEPEQQDELLSMLNEAKQSATLINKDTARETKIDGWIKKIELNLFVFKLQETRRATTFKERVDQLIAYMTQAVLSDANRKAFIDELEWMVTNKRAEQLTEIQRVLNAAKWNSLLINNDPTRIAKINDLARRAGIKITFTAMLENMENQINISYTDPKAKIYLEQTKDSFLKQLKSLVTESITKSPEKRDRLLKLVESTISNPIFEAYEPQLGPMREELAKPLTIETLLDRIKTGSATKDSETKTRFMRALEHIAKQTIRDIEAGRAPKNADKQLAYLLKVVKFSLEFNKAHKKIAQQLLTQVPTVEVEEEVEMVAPEKDAAFDEYLKYLVLMATENIFKSPEKKKAYFEIFSIAVAIPKLTVEQLEKLKAILNFVKQYPKFNDQDKALLASIRLKIEFLLKQMEKPETIDAKVNKLFEKVLTVGKTTPANDAFIKEANEVIVDIEKAMDKKEKVPALTKLQRLPDTMEALPNFQGTGETIKTQIEEMSKKIKSLVDKEKEEKEEKKKKVEKPTTQVMPPRRFPMQRPGMMPGRRPLIPVR